MASLSLPTHGEASQKVIAWRKILRQLFIPVEPIVACGRGAEKGYVFGTHGLYSLNEISSNVAKIPPFELEKREFDNYLYIKGLTEYSFKKGGKRHEKSNICKPTGLSAYIRACRVQVYGAGNDVNRRHALESFPVYVDAYGGMAVHIEQKEQGAIIEEIKGHLHEFCKKAEAQIGPPCVSLVSKILVPRGHPPEEILNTADKEGCDAIVLGTHGKRFLAHAFLGSVSSVVLHRTRKPVFIIPLPSEKAPFEWDKI